MVLMLSIVRLGSTSANARVTSGSSTPGGVGVFSKMPPIKWDCVSIFLIHLGNGMPRDKDHLAPVVGERIVLGKRGALDTRYAVKPCLELAIQRCQSRR